MKVINPDIDIDPTDFRVVSWESDGKRVEMVRIEAMIHFETFGLPITEIKDAFDTWTTGFDLAVGHTRADAYPGWRFFFSGQYAINNAPQTKE